MRSTHLLALLSLTLVFAAAAPAQAVLRVVPGGDGSDGLFAPTTNMTIDTSTQSTFNFTAMIIPAGVTVTLVGPLPAQFNVCGDALIDGILDGSGQAGGSSNNNTAGGLGGAGGPFGGAGGDGGAVPMSPFNGSGVAGMGPSGGQPGVDSGAVGGSFTDPVGGGGGGGNATAGQDGGAANSGITPTASGTGGPVGMPPCTQGSGGGGGGADIDDAALATSNDGGGGGGGGGGNISLNVNGALVVNGSILARGGDGGTSGGNGGGGGGGSGGVITVQAGAFTNTGTIDASGGTGGGATQGNCGCSPGGDGGDGCVTLIICDPSGPFPGISPAPMASTILATGPATLTPNCPKATIAVCGGSGGTYLLGVSATLGTPLMIPGFTFAFELNLLDPIFMATFPVNTFAPVIDGLSGPVPGTACIDLSLLTIPAGTTLSLSVQGIALQGGAPVDTTNRVDANIMY